MIDPNLSYQDLPFPIKIMFGYLVGILLLTVLFSISIFYLGTIVNDYDALISQTWRQLDSLQTIRSAGVGLKDNIMVGDRPAAGRSLAQLTEALNGYLGFNRNGEPLDLNIMIKDISSLRQQGSQLIVLPRPASPAELKAFNRTGQAFDGRLYFEIERARGNLQVAETRFKERISQMLLLDIILAPLGFLFIYYYGLMLANYTGLRLRRFLSQLKAISGGNYRARVKVDSRDELGQIAEAINHLAEKLSSNSNK